MLDSPAELAGWLRDHLGLDRPPSQLLCCAACGGIRFTRTSPGRWDAVAVLPAGDTYAFVSLAEGGEWDEPQSVSEPLYACDNRACARFNQDCRVSDAVVPGPGMWQAGDRVQLDGRVEVIAAIDTADPHAVSLSAYLTSGHVVGLHELRPTPGRHPGQGSLLG